MKTAEELRIPFRRGPVPGALVRTKIAWPGGIHRAEISRIVGTGADAVAVVAGQRYALDELEVIRPPVD